MGCAWKRAGLAAALLAAAGAAAAAEPPYRDDRSDAASLVASFYNAINRREYARAWAYFGEAKPSTDFESFQRGYGDTERVELETGAVAEEGAAGSRFFQIPVALRAYGTDGSERVFAGCYIARLADPNIQDVPFRPLQLEKGSLTPASGELEEAVPASCGGASPGAPRDAVREQVEKAFAAAYGRACDTLAADAEPDAATPEIFEIRYRDAADGDGADERAARLFRFQCGFAAYNSDEVYYVADDIGDVHQLQFAQPELDIRHANDDPEGRVESIGIIGYTVRDRIANSFYDPDSRTITSFAKWRGVGDASATGLYLFRDGQFSLVKYDVDASYDGEINPETVLDYDTAP